MTTLPAANTSAAGVMAASEFNTLQTLFLSQAQPNGIATLDASGKVPADQLTANNYAGTWNASTNTPTLASGVGTQGTYYIVSVAGSTNLDGETSWNVGDWAIFSGSAWEKVDNTQAPVDLSITDRATDELKVTPSGGGASATVPSATTSLSGLLTGADKTKLDGIATGAEVNVDTNLAVGTQTGTTLEVTSSTGTNVTLPEVLAGGNAGLLSGADKTKLDGIATGAEVNVDTNLAVGTQTGTTLEVTSSTGTNVTLPEVVAGSNAGLPVRRRQDEARRHCYRG